MKIILFLTFSLIIAASTMQNSYAWGLKDLGEEAASPVTTDAKYVLLAGSLVTLGFAIFEDQTVDPFQDKQVKNHFLGNSSRFGDWLGQNIPNFAYMGGMAIAGHYGTPKAHARAIGMMKATAYSSAVTTLLKYSIREPRPNDNSVKNSFPSGHTTTSFAFSGFVTAEHGWIWGGATLLMSTFVAYSRINDNMHRLQDITAGATIGWVYGWGISRLMNKKDAETNSYIMPILDSKTAGLSLYKEF